MSGAVQKHHWSVNSVLCAITHNAWSKDQKSAAAFNPMLSEEERRDAPHTHGLSIKDTVLALQSLADKNGVVHFG